MSKFDNVLKKIEEALPPMPAQQPATGQTNTAAAPTNNQQNQQAVQQAAKLLNIDPKVLQQLLDTQAQQKQTNTSTPTNTAV